MKKLNILLIDDDHTTNVFHTVIIRRSQIALDIQTMEMPELALQYLVNASKGQGVNRQFVVPELILLDVNMPRMTGWEFLSEYRKIQVSLKFQPIVYMLTAFLHPSDQDKYSAFDCVKGVLNKPLTEEVLLNIHKTHWG